MIGLMGAPVGFGVGGQAAIPISTVGNLSASGGGAISWPAGTAAGDHAIIQASAGAGVYPSLSGSGWSSEQGYIHPSIVQWYTTIFWKTLTAGDVSSPPSVSGISYGGYVGAVFRGGAAINRNTSIFPASSPSFPSGLTKGAGVHEVIVSLFGGGTAASTAPSGWTTDVDAANSYSRGHIISKPGPDYTDGTAITFTGGGSRWHIVALEIT